MQPQRYKLHLNNGTDDVEHLQAGEEAHHFKDM